MPISLTAQELFAKGKGYYGDPCYDSTFGSTKSECINQTPTGNLAKAVLDFYGIQISEDWVVGPKAAPHVTCCPLDILNQDPFACIKMSLMASLLDHEYWEVHADEWGKARFIKVLPEGEAARANISRVQWCIPSLQPADISNLVIVRSADSPPFRKCLNEAEGTENGWYNILDDVSRSSLRDWVSRGSIFPGGTVPEQNRADARGVIFTWGEVTGMCPMQQTTKAQSTCECGTFDQYGTIIYPDYERKQVYGDGVIDFVEVEGFEQILHWIVDIDYDLSERELQHYNIQFTKSSDVPVELVLGSTTYTHNIDETLDFGPVCDLSATGEGSSTTPNLSLFLDATSEGNSSASCNSVQTAITAARDRRSALNGSVSWEEYSIPPFYGFGWARSQVSFKEWSKWNIIGADVCVEHPIDNIYESTSELWGNGCAMNGFSYIRNTSYYNLGAQQGRRTMTLPGTTVWVESTPRDGFEDYIIYSLRAEAPLKATARLYYPDGDMIWNNPFENLMMQMVSTSAQNVGTYTYDTSLPYPGYLLGWDEGLYTVDEFWAKIKVARPGVAIRGLGRGVKNFLNTISMKVKPVYLVEIPSAIGVAGETWPPPGVSTCYVDLYEDLKNANKYYCDDLEKTSQMELLQEAQTGNTLDITLPFLFVFPDYADAGQDSPSKVNNRQAFINISEACCGVAQFLWDYISKYKDEANKGFTYITGPPTNQSEVLRLGDVVDTDHGPRTIRSISYSYNDGSSFMVNVDVGPVSISSAHAGQIRKKRVRNEDVRGKIVDQIRGALYKVDIPGIGVIKAWNIDRYPWNVGDRVTLTLYNHPIEV